MTGPVYIEIVNPEETRSFLFRIYEIFERTNNPKSMNQIKILIDQLDEYLLGWRPIVGFENYEISLNKDIRNIKTKRVMSLNYNNYDILTVSLRRDNKAHNRSVDALYRATFPELGLKKTRKPKRKNCE